MSVKLRKQDYFHPLELLGSLLALTHTMQQAEIVKKKEYSVETGQRLSDRCPQLKGETATDWAKRARWSILKGELFP